jgi:hypothetical protein
MNAGIPIAASDGIAKVETIPRRPDDQASGPDETLAKN